MKEKQGERMSFFQDKRVLVTGGSGFLGSFVVEKLKARGCKNIFVPRSKEYDLTKEALVQKLLKDFNPHVVIQDRKSVV